MLEWIFEWIFAGGDEDDDGKTMEDNMTKEENYEERWTGRY